MLEYTVSCLHRPVVRSRWIPTLRVVDRRTPGGGAGLELSEPETLEEPVAGRGPLGDPSLDFSQFPRLDFSQFPHLDFSKISKLISYLLDGSDTSA